MGAWIQYTRQRFSLITYMLLAGGLSLTPQAVLDQEWHGPEFMLGFMLLLLFFFTLRLMDERKDYDTDLIAHPERPLPQGVLAIATVEKAIKLLLTLMLAASAMLLIFIDLRAGFAYGLTSLWLWLMYREFYIGSFLQKRPFTYALTHQIIIIPLVLAMAFLIRPSHVELEKLLQVALLILSGFFSYEVGRKLDPQAHPLLHTYLHTYGRFRTSLLLVSIQVFGAWIAAKLGLILWFGPLIFLNLIASSLVFWAPQRYKLIELLVSVYLLATLWCGLLYLI